jgi:hypothetical protein
MTAPFLSVLCKVAKLMFLVFLLGSISASFGRAAAPMVTHYDLILEPDIANKSLEGILIIDINTSRAGADKMSLTVES